MPAHALNEQVVLHALQADAALSGCHIQVRHNDRMIVLEGQLANDTLRAQVLSAAAATGQPIDAGGLKVRVSDMRAQLLNRITRLNPELLRHLAWQERGNVLIASGSVRHAQALSQLRAALPAVTEFAGIDLSHVKLQGMLITVQKGETLSLLAKRYYGIERAFSRFTDPQGHELTQKNLLHIGEQLYAPGVTGVPSRQSAP